MRQLLSLILLFSLAVGCATKAPSKSNLVALARECPDTIGIASKSGADYVDRCCFSMTLWINEALQEAAAAPLVCYGLRDSLLSDLAMARLRLTWFVDMTTFIP